MEQRMRGEYSLDAEIVDGEGFTLLEIFPMRGKTRKNCWETSKSMPYSSGKLARLSQVSIIRKGM
jgi:hypothetical protein